MNRTWSDYQLFQLAMLCPHMTTREAARIIGKTAKNVKWAASRHKIVKIGNHYHPGSQYSKIHQDFIRQNYLTLPLKQIAEKIGGSFTGVAGLLKREVLSIPSEIVQERKNIGRYAKGRAPENKGKKWKDFMSKKGMRNSRKTQFKKGRSEEHTS